MRRQIPLAVCFLAGLFFLIQYFTPNPWATYVSAQLLNWTVVIGFFALCLGIISIWIQHLPKVMKRAPGWGYNAVTLAAFVSMVVCGVFFGKEPGGAFLWMYNNLLNPITATMFGLLAFFIASAAYRAFRIRSMLATILLASAVIVMLGRVPIGDFVLDKIVTPLGVHGLFGAASDWLLNVPNVAAKRALNVGIGFGQAAIALKLLIGIERSYLGGEK
jgi:hypothetical protein